MHEARAGVDGHVVGHVHRRGALVERMVEPHAVERLAGGGGDDAAFQTVALQLGRHAFLGQDQQRGLAVTLGLDQRVLDLGVQVQRLVGRQRPGRGGPDDGVAVIGGQLVQTEGAGHPLGLGKGKAHVHGGIGAVGVFHLGLGQRGTAVEAPVHGLEAPEHEAGTHDGGQRPDLLGLAGRAHRQVGVVPVAQHAQAHEVGLLLLDLLAGVGAAFGLHFGGGQVLAELLLDLVLDGHAVAVPAGHVAGIVAGQVV